MYLGFSNHCTNEVMTNVRMLDWADQTPMWATGEEGMWNPKNSFGTIPGKNASKCSHKNLGFLENPCCYWTQIRHQLTLKEAKNKYYPTVNPQLQDRVANQRIISRLALSNAHLYSPRIHGNVVYLATWLMFMVNVGMNIYHTWILWVLQIVCCTSVSAVATHFKRDWCIPTTIFSTC